MNPLLPSQFSTHFHTRSKPITPRPTPSSPSTSPTPIRIRPPRSNNHAVHATKVLTSGNYRATMPCDRQGLSLSDDSVVSASPLYPARLSVIFFRSSSSDLLLPPPNSKLSTFNCSSLPLPQITSQQPLVTNPFRIRTYAKSAYNSFRIRTSKTKHLKRLCLHPRHARWFSRKTGQPQ
jgi:hypothetical protein